ncbi:ABC transporter ATP-binding protein [Hathewaya histolytica]|uniref:ABC transporter ATP-binding protein n=1 Tax=Hathewaya histolytica TaxID=1498 RepID=UPI003B684CAE
MENILEVKNLRKNFNVGSNFLQSNKTVFKAVDDISFNIQKGTIMGLVGESGCGKSTTGKLILNLIKPSSGKVLFDRKIIYDVENKIEMKNSELRELRRHMQIIFQDPYSSLDPRKNVEQIIGEGLKKHKLCKKSELKNTILKYLNKCGLQEDSLKKYPHEFSGGQRQRIGIARALSLNPKFIVCDEPTAALDVSIQSQILNLMLELKETYGLTYLFISHNLNIVKNFCDNIGVMYLGTLVEKGETKEIFKEPLHPYTKALISSVPKSHPLEKREKIILKGEIPTASNIPKGCRFNTRCPYATEKCQSEEPKLLEIKPKHFVACHLYQE